MNQVQQCDVSYSYNGATQQGRLHIEEKKDGAQSRFRAVIDNSPLHGTYGGYAESVELALDFLNLAMQAEGADEITFSCQEAT